MMPGLDVCRRIWSYKIDPRLPKHKKEAADYTGAVAIIDACRPYHWIDEFPATTQISEELLKETNAKWESSSTRTSQTYLRFAVFLK
jgi:hypothetical protein